jgi:hypothetical protein
MKHFSTALKEVYANYLQEDMTSAAFGPDSMNITDMGLASADTYAPNDARMPSVIGKRSRKSKKRKKNNNIVFRRNFS